MLSCFSSYSFFPPSNTKYFIIAEFFISFEGLSYVSLADNPSLSFLISLFCSILYSHDFCSPRSSCDWLEFSGRQQFQNYYESAFCVWGGYNPMRMIFNPPKKEDIFFCQSRYLSLDMIFYYLNRKLSLLPPWENPAQKDIRTPYFILVETYQKMSHI